MSGKKVLIVEGRSNSRQKLYRVFSQMGLVFDRVDGTLERVARATSDGYDMVVFDVSGEDGDAMSALGEIARDCPEIPVIAITDCNPLSSSLEAMRCGAYDCLERPLRAEQVRLVAERALEWCMLIEENRRLRDMVCEPSSQRPLRDVEKAHIERVLISTNWNQTRSAEMLGIDRKTLRNKIKEFRLEPLKPAGRNGH